MDRAIAEEVAAAFMLGPVTAEPRFVERGAMGEIWRVDTGDRSWAVKRLFPWADYPAHPFDVAVQRAAADRGIPLPAPVIADSGTVVTRREQRFRVYEWVDLGPQLTPPIPAERAAEAGGLLGRIHSLGMAPPTEPIDGWYLETHDQAAWHAMSERARRAGAAWAEGLEHRLPLIADLHRRVQGDIAASHLCHRDFGPDNVLPRAGDGSLVVLDWENVGPLPADQELASGLENWATHGGRVDPDGARRFFREYQRSGGRAVLLGPTSFLSAVCAVLNFLHVLASQALDEPEHRSFAEPRVNDILRYRLTNLAAAIDALLTLELR